MTAPPVPSGLLTCSVHVAVAVHWPVGCSEQLELWMLWFEAEGQSIVLDPLVSVNVGLMSTEFADRVHGELPPPSSEAASDPVEASPEASGEP
jgi:hypothetical protein